ncbi:MAG: NADPH-dependent 7-cyano-7-deazaguanine reductase QueF, partial [Planctomycetes bacterium]|nr:NADPH-dependent 7-cyano-7-deazaguanine reductase QueF [Planctomycetota bacterium]
DREYSIRHEVEEFTSLCPKTGHPDFAELSIVYIPGATCLELKSLKLYLQGYRNEGIFYEAATNKILDDLAAACTPQWMEIEARWSTRGGIHSIINVTFDGPEEE